LPVEDNVAKVNAEVSLEALIVQESSRKERVHSVVQGFSCEPNCQLFHKIVEARSIEEVTHSSTWSQSKWKTTPLDNTLVSRGA
jgi:hypothetical protein